MLHDFVDRKQLKLCGSLYPYVFIEEVKLSP